MREFLARLLMLLFGGSGQSKSRSIVVNGRSRSYRLHVPSNVPDEAPLVLVFHGATMNGSSMEWYTGFSAEADRQGFIVAYPDGISRRFNQRDDVEFTRDMIDDIDRVHSVDRTRVFACGLSNGGYFSFRLAAEVGQDFAAVGVVGGGMNDRPWATAAKVNVIQIHGTADRIVRFSTSGANAWAIHNKCGAAVTKMIDGVDDGMSVKRKVWGTSSDGFNVEFYEVTGGGHTWPGANASWLRWMLGPTGMDIDATRKLWSFFERHKR